MKHAVKLTQFGRKLNGKYGVTGVMVTTMTIEEVQIYIENSRKHGMTVDVDWIGNGPTF